MRYLPLTADDRAEMLKTIGAKSVDDFYADVPEAARLNGTVEGLPDHQGELAVERHMSNLAAKNRALEERLTSHQSDAAREQERALMERREEERRSRVEEVMRVAARRIQKVYIYYI